MSACTHLCSLTSDTCCTPTDCNFGIKNSLNCSQKSQQNGIFGKLKQYQTYLVRVSNRLMNRSCWRICKLLRRPAEVLAESLVNVIDLHRTWSAKVKATNEDAGMNDNRQPHTTLNTLQRAARWQDTTHVRLPSTTVRQLALHARQLDAGGSWSLGAGLGPVQPKSCSVHH
jgi:hypothetical protein